MDYIPISLRVRDQVVLVVGGGEVAARKAALLVRAGARLRVVSPEQVAAMRALLVDAHHTLQGRAYRTQDVTGAALAVAASDDPAVNAQVSRDARAKGVPVNVVDDPAKCTFVMPSLVDRDPLFIAISTAGTSPVLARMTRARLDAALPERLGDLARLLGRYRSAVKQAFATVVERRAFWERVLEGPVAELASQGRVAEAERQLERDLAGPQPASGAVHLVGVGPGDPDQLTLRAQRSLQYAEQLLFDQAVPDAILDRARRDAPRRRVAEPVDLPALAAELLAGARRGERICWLTLGTLGERERALRESLAHSAVSLVEVHGVVVSLSEGATSR